MSHHRHKDGEVDVGEAEPSDGDEERPLRFRFSWRKLWRFTGPAWLMSLAYLDPGNLEGDLQQGAYTGLRLVWVLWWASVMGFMLQEKSARIAIVSGCDLAQLVRMHYPRWLNYVIYVMVELAVVGADIQVRCALAAHRSQRAQSGAVSDGLSARTALA